MKRNSVFFTLVILVSTVFLSCNRLLYYPTDKIYNDYVLSKYNDFFIESSSGNMLNAVHIKVNKPKALIVHFHGNARNLTAHFKAFEWAAAYGYEVLSWDYSGYGRSTGNPTPDNLYADSLTILNYAVEIRNKKKYPLIVIGQSLGGAVLLGALESFEGKGMVDMVVADCTFSSYREIVNYKVEKLTLLPIPLGDILISDRYAPADNLSALRDLPILVTHCREDIVVPFIFGVNLYNKLENRRKWFRELSCKHTAGYWRKENQEALLDFFNKELFGHEKE